MAVRALGSASIARVAFLVFFIAVHLAATLLAPAYFASEGLVTLFWPASGIALAAVLAGGYSYAWATMVSCTIAALLMPEKGLVQAFFTLANVLEIFLGRLLVLRIARIDIGFDRSRDYIAFLVVAGILLPVPAAVIAAATIHSVSQAGIPFWFHLQQWWMSDSLGIISLTPLLLIWRRMPEGWFARRQLIEAALGLLLVVATGWLVFLSEIEYASTHNFVFFIFVAWAATRFGRHATLLVTSIVIGFALTANSSVILQHSGRAFHYAHIWLFMVTLSTVGMALATVFNERRQSLLRHTQLLEAYRAEEARRRNFESAAEKSAIDFERLVQTATEGVWTIDHSGSTTFVNQRMADMVGEQPEAMLGKSFYDYMRDDDLTDGQARLGRRNSGISESHECVLMHRNGNPVWTWMSTSPITDIEGNVTGALALVTDISARKQVEIALRECEDRHEHIMNLISDAVLIHQSGIILYANPAAAELLGAKDPASLVGMNSLNFTHPDEHEILVERMKQLLQKETGTFLPPIRQRMLLRNGRLIFIESVSGTISYKNRKALLVVARRV